MAQRQNKEGAAALSTFLVSLTDTDQLTMIERRGVKSIRRDDARKAVTRLRDMADIAYHETGIAQTRMKIAWHSDLPENARRDGIARRSNEHDQRVHVLIRHIEQMMAVPRDTKGAVVEMGRAIKGYGDVVSGNAATMAVWRATAARWHSTLTTDAARFGSTTPVEASA